MVEVNACLGNRKDIQPIKTLVTYFYSFLFFCQTGAGYA